MFGATRKCAAFGHEILKCCRLMLQTRFVEVSGFTESRM